MTKYHISADGNVRQCRAQSPETCRVTGDIKTHFNNKDEAGKAFELHQKSSFKDGENVSKNNDQAQESQVRIIKYTIQERESFNTFALDFSRLSELVSSGVVARDPYLVVSHYNKSMASAGRADEALQKNPNYKNNITPFSDLLRKVPVSSSGLIANFVTINLMNSLIGFTKDIEREVPLGTTFEEVQKNILFKQERERDFNLKQKMFEEMEAESKKKIDELNAQKEQLEAEIAKIEARKNRPLNRFFNRIFPN